MNINIDKKAEAYIKDKSQEKAIQIGIKKVGSGWCVSFEPFVKMGEPFEISSYKHYNVGDINVYIPPKIKAINNKISVSHSKFLWINSLSVEGLIL